MLLSTIDAPRYFRFVDFFIQNSQIGVNLYGSVRVLNGVEFKKMFKRFPLKLNSVTFGDISSNRKVQVIGAPDSGGTKLSRIVTVKFAEKYYNI